MRQFDKKLFNLFYLILVLGACVLALGWSSNLVLASGIKAANTFGGWSVHVMGQKKQKVCYIHGKPKKSSGNYAIRGDSYIQVVHRLKNKVRNEVSITAGYTFKKGTEVAVKISDQTFKLFTDGETAWSKTASDDASLVAAMRAGTKMIVTGRSSRGTLTKDHYSLVGFTAANRSIDKSCGYKN
ncbi:MAG: hypothetical protein CMM37_00645 [Rhodospirillaceae bacterium]|jgi:dTDP-glucose pyrophosphorylase|nr:hypothetical protein [Rhodospirillaceae bacterium]